MKTKTLSFSLYVGTYAKYNNGNLFGEWLNLADYSCKDDFYKACAELHSDETDPEFMFQDSEGLPDSWYNESYIDDKVFDFLQLDEHDQKIVLMYADATGYSLSDIVFSDATDNFHGTADSYAEFAEEIAEQTCCLPKDLPSWIEYAIDWESAWNCSLQYDYMTATDDNGTIYFFLNH